jgi:4,5-DOPA dioxygenase extradiol
MRRAPQRGLDHGVWTPLVHLFPRADRPVLEISLPSALGAEAVFDLGRKLAPLRDEGVLLVGSGNITHNLRAMAPEGTPPEPEYVAFDAWVAERLLSHDTAALVAAPRTAPGFRRNHPTLDHWLPLLFPLGAAAADDAVRFPVTGWEYGNLSRRAVLFG